MNLLAHLHLGKNLTPVMAAGNLVADYWDQSESENYARGVKFHRAIDAYTDAHPLAAEARALFRGKYRRFGGVISDLAFDHALSVTWADWEPDTSRGDFIDSKLDVILSAKALLPDQAADVIQNMRHGGWLHRYSRIEGLADTISDMSRRRPVALGMVGSHELIDKVSEPLTLIFGSLYSDILDFASRQLNDMGH